MLSIYRKNNNSWELTQHIPIVDTPKHILRNSVDLRGEILVIGSIYADLKGRDYGVIDTGAAYLYRKQHGIWVLENTLTTTDSSGYDLLGTTVLVDDDEIFEHSYAGQTYNDQTGALPGGVYVYDIPDTIDLVLKLLIN